MTEKEPDGGPAFPVPDTVAGEQVYCASDGKAGLPGMSLRDYFAAAALPAHAEAISAACLTPAEWHAEVATLSYRTADAMLKAREA